jgi:tetratricopeptide (TPR) repeat protein
MKKINKIINIVVIFMLIGVFLWQELAYSSDIFYLRVPMGIDKNRAIEILTNKDWAVEEIKAKRLLFRNCIKQDFLASASQAINKAYQIFQAYPDALEVRDQAKHIIANYNALSSAYVKARKLPEAQQATDQAYQIFQAYPDAPGVRNQAEYIIANYNTLSSVYVKANKLSEVQQAADQTYQIFQAYPDALGVRDEAKYIITNYNVLSFAYVKAGKLPEAQQAADQTYQIFQAYPDAPGVRNQANYIIANYNALCSAYVKARKLPKAKQAANQAYWISQTYPDAPGVRNQAEYIIANYFKLISRLNSEIENSEIVQVFLQKGTPIDKNFIALTVVAFLYFRTSQTEKAVNLAKKAEKIDGYSRDARIIPWAIIRAAGIISRKAGPEAVFSDMRGAKDWLIRAFQDAIVYVATRRPASELVDYETLSLRVPLSPVQLPVITHLEESL